ncbi:MAG: prephenate dehydratase [Deltaproteobacteria bacterium]|nr:prephenate dehydratase [Deltaproteobacteria bacterium]
MVSKGNKTNSVRNLRQRIDQIDERITDLLHKRGKVALEIVHAKGREKLSTYDPSREREVFERVLSHSGPFPKVGLRAIFREILSASRSLQRQIQVGYLGPQGTFTHEATLKHFGESASLLATPRLADVFRSVEQCELDYGVVPVENSLEGVVSETLDLLLETPLKICAEIILTVRHSLLTRERRLEEIQRVYSHPIALAQCRRWLAEHLPNAIKVGTESTAAAVQKVLKEGDSAAIAGPLAAKLYRMKPLRRNIQDRTEDLTRFLVLSRQEASPTSQDKTTLILSLKNRPGALYQALRPLAQARINLTKIESRPAKNEPWSYLFFIDCDGNYRDPRLSGALRKVEPHCRFVKLLGSYPRGDSQGLRGKLG